MVAPGRVAGDEFAEESGHEQLRAEYHGRQGEVEVGRVGHEGVVLAGVHVVEFERAHDDYGDESEHEHQAAEQTEEVHRLDAEAGLEPEREQVEVSVYEAVEAEFRHAVLSRLVVDRFLADFLESGDFGEVGHVAVHVAVHLDMLDHFGAVGFQAAVEVVQVLDSAHAPGRGVEQFGGQGFRQRVVAFFLPSAHEVVSVLGDHAVEFGYLVGAVLQIGVHGDDHVAFGAREAGVQRGRLSVVPAEAHAFELRVARVDLLDHVPRLVGAAVVNHEHLVTEAVLGHDALDPLGQLGQRLGLVV